MAWRRLLTQVAKQKVDVPCLREWQVRPSLILSRYQGAAGTRFLGAQERVKSTYVGNIARRVRDVDGANDTVLLKELYRSDAEGVIRLFESQPSLHSNQLALSEYIKALVKVDRLDESALLKTLQRGISNSMREEESLASFSALRNVGKSTKDGVLGTANAPIHMVTSEGGYFKDQLWRTLRTMALAFLLISGVGALIEDRGISKGLGLNEDVQPSMESNTRFQDVKGVDEAKAELEEIVHYLRDPKAIRHLFLF